MEETLIKLETAKLAKEKGFDSYSPLGYNIVNGKVVSLCYAYSDNKDNVKAYRQSLLQKWLRNKYNLHIDISIDIESYWTLSIIGLNAEILQWDQCASFQTYEQALEEGLKQALNLIPKETFSNAINP